MAELAPAVAGQWAAPRSGEAAGLAALRRGAMARFQRAGLPGPRTEAWRYTNLNNLAQIPFAAPANDAAPVALPEPLLADGAVRLVLANGRLRTDLAHLAAVPAGLRIRSLIEALADEPALAAALGDGDEPMLALNAALMADGLLIEVAAGAEIATPVELISAGSADSGAPIAFHPRHLLRLGAGAALTLVESHGGSGAVLVAPRAAGEPRSRRAADPRQAAGRVGRGLPHRPRHRAAGRRRALRRADPAGRRRAGAQRRAGGARRRVCFLRAGRPLSRSRPPASRQHAGGAARGAADRQQAALQGRARRPRPRRLPGPHRGRNAMPRRATGSSSPARCCSPTGAEIDTKPELEIYADDVKCSHGAAAGDIDEDALFYLRARGIDRMAARRMLIEAFFGETLQEVESEALRRALGGRVDRWLAGLADEESR
jgi:Fe-S cluster assembly protein SufD